MKKFPFYWQVESMDCGLACLRMLAQYYGRSYPLSVLRERCNIHKTGMSIKSLSEAAEFLGLKTFVAKIPLCYEESLKNSLSLNEAPLPCIVHWNQNHFVVVYKITKSKVLIADPSIGKIRLRYSDFNKSYHDKDQKGIALLVETTPAFYNLKIGSFA